MSRPKAEPAEVVPPSPGEVEAAIAAHAAARAAYDEAGAAYDVARRILVDVLHRAGVTGFSL